MCGILNIQGCLWVVIIYLREEEALVLVQKFCPFHIIKNSLAYIIELPWTIFDGEQRGSILMLHCKQGFDCHYITFHCPYITSHCIYISAMRLHCSIDCRDIVLYRLYISLHRVNVSAMHFSSDTDSRNISSNCTYIALHCIYISAMQITGSIDGTLIHLVYTVGETSHAKRFVHYKPHTAKHSCHYTYACSYNFY